MPPQMFEENPNDANLGDTTAEPQQTAEPEVPAPEPTISVPLKPGGRRAKAVDELTQKIDALTSTIAERDQAHARERSEMEARFAAVLQRPVILQQPAPQQQPEADPVALSREAKKLLDAGDFEGYHAKTLESAAIMAERRLAPRFQQTTQQQPASMPPEMMALYAAHPEVARHPNHMAMLAAKNYELESDGVPGGPARVARVFAEVEAKIKAGKRSNGVTPQFSQSTAGALSGVPTARGGGGNGESRDPTMDLTRTEEKWAIKSGMGTKRYAEVMAELHPERKKAG